LRCKDNWNDKSDGKLDEWTADEVNGEKYCGKPNLGLWQTQKTDMPRLWC